MQNEIYKVKSSSSKDGDKLQNGKKDSYSEDSKQLVECVELIFMNNFKVLLDPREENESKSLATGNFLNK